MKMLSILKHQTGHDAPMDIFSGIVIHREYKTKSKSRLYRADGVQIGSEASVAGKARLAGVILIHRRFTNQFKHRNELLHAGIRNSLC
jgi:hypothetical protein